MGRRKLKQRYLSSVLAREKLGMLTSEQAEGFRLMLARCLRPADFEQVLDVLRDFCGGIMHASDRHALLMQEDPLGLDCD